MEAPLVRAFLEALPPAPPDDRAVERVRSALASLQDPDIRYLVAAVMGSEAAGVSRVMAAVLGAAGAPTGMLGRSLSRATVAGGPLDDALIGAAGTLAASAVYQLHEVHPALGEMSRREAEVVLGLVAFAEAGQRVAILVDEGVAPADPLHAPKPDVVVVSAGAPETVTRALALAPADRPVVVGAVDGEAREAALEWEKGSRSPLLLAGRDHDVRAGGDGRDAFLVRGETYVTFEPLGGIARPDLSCALAAALTLGAMGIRMREEWLLAGLDALRRDPVTT